MNILGIETSCDETAAAVVVDGKQVRSNIINSQVAKHQPFGGVVPEIASRAHVETLPDVIHCALEQAGLGWEDLDALAVTRGPGLASSLLIGLCAAKALALRLRLPVVGINHLQAHLYSIFLGEEAPECETLGSAIILLVSGGHTCLVRMNQDRTFRLLGQTLDDAAGEALDKGATLLGLGYPGGPAIEKAAAGGAVDKRLFPQASTFKSGVLAGGLDRKLCFSFSGLKTALRYYLERHPDVVHNGRLKDVSASYQEAVFNSLVARVACAVEKEGDIQMLACVGGVACNKRLRNKLQDLANGLGIPLALARPEYCTDNAAMVAALADSRPIGHAAGPDAMDVVPRLSLMDD